MSAWGPGPWEGRRGFDSLVQTASGLNASEAVAAGQGEAARPLPCQALDHGAGYLLAAGVLAAVHRPITGDGGSDGESGWDVDVSLAGVMELLKALGRQDVSDQAVPSVVETETYLERTCGGLGEVVGVRFPATVEGVVTSLGPPSVRGTDKPEWL